MSARTGKAHGMGRTIGFFLVLLAPAAMKAADPGHEVERIVWRRAEGIGVPVIGWRPASPELCISESRAWTEETGWPCSPRRMTMITPG